MPHAFVTGSAGFIGFHLSQRLLADGWSVVGIDNLNDYYDVELKKARLAILKQHPGFSQVEAGIEDKTAVDAIFDSAKFDGVPPNMSVKMITPLPLLQALTVSRISSRR